MTKFRSLSERLCFGETPKSLLKRDAREAYSATWVLSTNPLLSLSSRTKFI